MTVQHLEFLVEERSMEAALNRLLPRMLVDISFQVYPFQNKSDMLRKLPHRLAGYANRIRRDPGFRDHCRVVVLIDRDDDDCFSLKGRLEDMAVKAGLTTFTRQQRTTWHILNRIVIEELEAWFFGDWDAVRTAYPRVNKKLPNQAGYRNPDAIAGWTWEALERVLKRSGYFATGLRKTEAARQIAGHMTPAKNRSRSFQVFRDALGAIR